jgi:hypothetical protein
MLGRNSRKLRYYDKAIGDSGLDRGVARAEIRRAPETPPRQSGPQLVVCPAPHHELIGTDAFMPLSNENMLLGDHEPSVLWIQLASSIE